MAHYDNEARAKFRSRKLDTANLRRLDNVAGDANDKQVAQALVKYDFGGRPRIRTPQDDGKRLLSTG